jgi:hypothetical protein
MELCIQEGRVMEDNYGTLHSHKEVEVIEVSPEYPVRTGCRKLFTSSI